ncbi:MAG: TonB-dependent receptor, partial [Pedobacter sp.]
VEGSRNSISINNLPGGTIFNNSDQQFNNNIFRQKADATYTFIVDSTSTIKVTASGSVGDSKTTDHFTARSTRDSLLLNTDDRVLSNNGKQEQFNSSLLWNKKLPKKGRTISVFASQALNRDNTEGYLNAVNEFYSGTGSQPDSIRRTDQYKVNKSFGNTLRTNVTYSEPIAKNLSAVINYGLNINNSSSDRRSFNKSASGSYDVLDTQFSNNFELDQTTNQVGASFNYQQAKTTLNFGTKVSDVKFKQYDVYADKTYQRNFTNWNPQATYRYRFSQQSGIGLTYRGNNSQPGIDQIQPIRVNTDPLNITLGNPDLKPSFTNNFSVDYSTYKILSEQYIYISAYYSFTNNAITNNTVTDDAGKNTFQAVNIKDNTPANFYIYASMERKVKKIDAAVGLEFNSNGYSSFNMVNNELSKTMFGDYYGNIYISKQAAKKYSFRASVGPAYTSMTSSLQSNNSKGWGVDASGNFTVFLPGKVEISSDASYQYKKPTQVFAQNLDRFIWNAAISKKFFKSENLRATLRGNDLMNQNNG